MFTYKELCTLGSALILISSSFIMGVFYSNQAYDYHLLFNSNASQVDFDNALKHYQILFHTGRPILYILAAIAAIGLLGNIIRIYKPNPELQIFEYCSLGLYVLGICVFITNIKTGIECSISHQWGEVSENQGLAVIGSSNIILLVMFFGVLLLQFGLWYSEWDYEKRLNAFYEEEAKEQKQTQPEKQQGKKNKKKDNKKNK